VHLLVKRILNVIKMHGTKKLGDSGVELVCKAMYIDRHRDRRTDRQTDRQTELRMDGWIITCFTLVLNVHKDVSRCRELRYNADMTL
jgi:hypothetical protein